ncbi:hypothetical protein AgCh_010731 [Apium graveolens]
MGDGYIGANLEHVAPNVAIEELTSSVEEDPNVTGNVDPRNTETGDIVSSRLASPDIEDKHVLDGYLLSSMQNTTDDCPDDGLLLSKKRVLVIMKFLVVDSELADVAARGLEIAALKAPVFGERKSQYLVDISNLTGGTVIREEVGLTLDKTDKDVLVQAAKVVLTKDATTIVGDGSMQEAVSKRVSQIRNYIEAGVEEGIVVGGSCTLLRLTAEVYAIKDSLENDEEKVGADIVKRALSYPLKLIAKNAGVNGSVVSEKILPWENQKYGYNAATGKYEDLMGVGITDPTKGVKFDPETGHFLHIELARSNSRERKAGS